MGSNSARAITSKNRSCAQIVIFKQEAELLVMSISPEIFAVRQICFLIRPDLLMRM